MYAGLTLVSLGTGFFKGNLQVLVGNLYDDPKYSSRRDSAFSLFYMAINIGAMFAPSMAKWITNQYLSRDGFTYAADAVATYGERANEYLTSLYGAYGLCFGVACVSHGLRSRLSSSVRFSFLRKRSTWKRCRRNS